MPPAPPCSFSILSLFIVHRPLPGGPASEFISLKYNARRAGNYFRVSSRESGQAESGDVITGLAGQQQFGADAANHRAELEAMPRKTCRQQNVINPGVPVDD